MSVGQRIRRCRQAAGLSQAELGRRLGVTRQAMCRIEHGLVRLSAANRLYEIARMLGVRMEDLMNRPELTRWRKTS